MASNLVSTPQAALKPAKPHGNTRISREIAEAITLMVEEGLAWDQAAAKVNIHVRTMRLALEKPHVIRFLKDKRDVFRENVSAANIHRARAIRDQDDNKMAAIQAMRFIEQLGEEQGSGPGARMPAGLTIVIAPGASAAISDSGQTRPAMIEAHNGLTSHKSSD
jgi:predicted DNA-binding protein (UPF0251 family)